eukprot:6977310-Prymnesium_polylepis.1
MGICAMASGSGTVQLEVERTAVQATGLQPYLNQGPQRTVDPTIAASTPSREMPPSCLPVQC